jgi:hypothetical protein
MLYKINVNDITGIEDLPVQNHHFEQPVKEDVIPGWTSMFGTDEQVLYTISVEQTARNKSVALMSHPIEVTGEDIIRAADNLFILDGTASFMIRFYDASGCSHSNKLWQMAEYRTYR